VYNGHTRLPSIGVTDHSHAYSSVRSSGHCMLRLVTLMLVTQLAACSLLHDRRDAPWDPKHPQGMLEQIPNWDGEANRVCGGHLPPEQRRGRSARC
jgi:hypothetical protein